MKSDESLPTISGDDAEWIVQQRQDVIAYLASQSCQHGGVSLSPRWFLAPYVAIWAVRSHMNPELVGWWAISGDLPTDYMTASDQQGPGDILIAFAESWRVAADRMAAGQAPAGVTIGEPTGAKELAPMLQSRAKLLFEVGTQLKQQGA